MYKILNNITFKYIEKIETLTRYDISIDEKKISIINITEEYFNETGNLMPDNLLKMLTNWFLECVLKSKNVDKVSKTEYPILSTHQIKRRNQKQISTINDTLDYIYQSNTKSKNKY